MLLADAIKLRCDNGTIFGREVVPEVCRINAVASKSSASTGLGSTPNVNRPATSSSLISRTSTFCARAASTAGGVDAFLHEQQLRLKVI